MNDDRLRAQLTELEDSAPAGPVPAIKQRLPGWLAGVTAAAGVVALVATVGILASIGRPVASPTPAVDPTAEASRPPQSTAPTTTPDGGASATPAPSASATPTNSPAAEAGAWEAATIQPFSEEIRRRLAYRGIQWFDGVGWMVHGIHQDGVAGIWISADGLEWVLAGTPAPPEGEGYDIVDIAVADAGGSRRYVAVGNRVVAAAGGWAWGTGSVVLTSDDGAEWALAPAVPATATWLSAVTASSAGFVAVGPDVPFPSGPEPPDARVWASADGETWTESAPADLVDSLPLGIEVLGETIVAYGFPISPEGGTPLTAWSTADLASWTASAVRASETGSGALDAAGAVDGGAMILVGNLDGPFAALSEDGADWSVEHLSTDPYLPQDVDGRDGAVVIAGAIPTTGEGPPIPNPLWVRDAPGSPWRAVDWYDEASQTIEIRVGYTAPIGIAIGADRMALVLGDGMVLLTGGRLP